ncbi:hypothetical protein EDB89DRAFT_1909626 [Lactarius sanguifluus]|nr:hypothetical protein EDB89DRAFT_1909626 [Lactarius sanguifluus]
MNSDMAGRGGDGVGGAEAASAVAVSTGGLFAGPKGWRWRWLWWWQCRGGSDEGCGCGGNGDDWYTDEREWERRQLKIKKRKKKKTYLRGAGGATGVGGGGSGCDGNGGDLYVHKGKRGDVDGGYWAGAQGAGVPQGMVWRRLWGPRGGSDEGWCHRQRDITRVRMRGVQHSQLVTKLHESVRLKRCGDERGKDHVVKTTAWEKFFPCSTGNLWKRTTCYMSTATVVTATSPRAHTGHIPSLLPPTPVATTAASTPCQFPVHPPSPDVNVAPASPRACKATLSLQPPLLSPVPICAPSTPQLPHQFLTCGQDVADDALGRCPVHQDTMLSFPHRSLQHRAGKTPPLLIRRDDTMARDDMSRCDNLTTCKNRTGYEHRPPRRAKPRIDVCRAGGHDINTAPQPYGTAVRLRHRLGPATLQRQWDVARTRHLPRRLRHQQHNGIVVRPRHRHSLQALPRRYGANTAARKPRRVPATPTAARQAGVR